MCIRDRLEDELRAHEPSTATREYGQRRAKPRASRVAARLMGDTAGEGPRTSWELTGRAQTQGRAGSAKPSRART
eukprot:9738329-Alexandrium_andersonii.AAC.1